MHINFRNIPAKFHPNKIWNDGALGFFEDGHSNKNNKMSDDMRKKMLIARHFCCL